MLLIQTQESLVYGNLTQGRRSLILDMNRLVQNKDKVEMLCKELDDYNKRIGWLRKLEQERAKVEMLYQDVKDRKDSVRERSEEKTPIVTKSLEDLFNKTTAGPAIYWRPLTEEEIEVKIKERNYDSLHCDSHTRFCA